MALQFDVDVFGAEDGDELVELITGFVDAASLQGRREWTFNAASEADEAFGMLFEFLRSNCAFAFLRSQLHFRDQAAEILVADTRGDEKGKTKRWNYALAVPRGFVIPSVARNPYPLCEVPGVEILRLRKCFTS